MEDRLKDIFNMAVRELPNKLHEFHGESSVLYRGFKISKTNDGYLWQDIRFSDYYEPVDPKITENVLSKGFTKTLTEVMRYSDEDKVLKIEREIEKLDNLISYWTSESSKLWAKHKKNMSAIDNNKDIPIEECVRRKQSTEKRYEYKKNLYQKKRRVIFEEREELKADLKFYKSRIKLYNN